MIIDQWKKDEDQKAPQTCLIFLRIAWTVAGLEIAFSASVCPLPIANVGVKGDGPAAASEESNLLELVNPCHDIWNNWYQIHEHSTYSIL